MERRDLLRFATIGSVDDGKSTLIGRLLYETGTVHRDQWDAVVDSSRKLERVGADFSLVMDGLRAEREQSITIDVGYRRFCTARREYLVADTPGHEQYTRNMVTGASTAALVILLLDARTGIRTQSKRHAFIASLLGVADVIVAVNKMDLVDYSKERFREICAEYEGFCAKLSLSNLAFVPVSALAGENIVSRGTSMSWYEGPTILEHLENAYVGKDRNLVDLRLPIQLVLKSGAASREYAGTIVSGVLRTGEDVMVMPGGQRATTVALRTGRGEVERAFAPQPVSIALGDDIDVSRGDVLVHPGNRPRAVRKVQAMLVWMSEDSLGVDRPYLLACGTSSVRAVVHEVVFRIDPETLHRESVRSLGLNEIGRVEVETFRPLVCDDFTRNRHTGSFILIDPTTCATVAAGMILDRGEEMPVPPSSCSEPISRNIVREAGQVARRDRERLLDQIGAAIWLTGLSGSGKTTIAYALERELVNRGHLAYVIDGDNVRHGLNRDLGFSPADRTENIRRVAEVAALMRDTGAIVICAFISPYAEDRAHAAKIVGEVFVEVFVDAPLEVCEDRDRKGLYAKARAGEILDFTGISAPYEVPERPDVHLHSDGRSADENVAVLVEELRRRGVIR